MVGLKSIFQFNRQVSAFTLAEEIVAFEINVQSVIRCWLETDAQCPDRSETTDTWGINIETAIAVALPANSYSMPRA